MKTYTFTKSYEMFEEAKKLVPNGIYGPRSPIFLTFGSYPCFLARGKGSHVWDVDGNEYIDYMCSFGTNILGMGNAAVDDAARAQMEDGNCFTLPSIRWNDMAKRLVNLISGMDWTVFAKNGSDVTTYGVTVARHATKKRVVMFANGAYHGSHYWCSHNTNGIPPEYKAHVEHFAFNDLVGVGALFEKHRGDVAAVMLTPHHHPAMADQVMPAPGFYDGVRNLCDREGALLIIDDIRCNFRIHLNGSHVAYGARPDMVIMGKAMANGYPIAAALGVEKLKDAAKDIFFTGTHFFSAVPMAAALKTIDIIEKEEIVEKIAAQGEKLKKGMLSLAKANGVGVSYTGHVSMPFMSFQDDPVFEKNRMFCGEAARRGVFLHPHHNWFLSAAHSDGDIEKTLEVTDECFKIVKDKK